MHLRKFFNLALAKYAFFRGETLISGRNRPYCKAILWPKRHPFVRQNVKSGPFCKAKFSQTHPLRWHTRNIPGIGRTPPGQPRNCQFLTDLCFTFMLALSSPRLCLHAGTRLSKVVPSCWYQDHKVIWYHVQCCILHILSISCLPVLISVYFLRYHV